MLGRDHGRRRQRGRRRPVVFIAAGWWVLATLIGSWIGRRATRSTRRSRGCSPTRAAATMMPEHRPGPRCWSTGCGRCCCATIAAGALAFIGPQIPAIAAGFAIIWALAWRRQDAAVHGDRGARRRRASTSSARRRSGRSSSSARRASGRERPTINGRRRSSARSSETSPTSAGAKTSAGRKLPTLTSLMSSSFSDDAR